MDTSTTTTTTSGLQVRSFQVRATDPDQRTVSGIAVPYDTITELWPGYREQVASGAVTVPDQGILLTWRHDDPIGKVTSSSSEADGFHITARISQTPRGDEAWQLVKDGVIDRLSIGFEEDDWTELEDSDGYLRTQTNIIVREVALIPFPAYSSAAVTGIRQAHTNPKGSTMDDNDKTPGQLDELRSQVSELRTETADLRRDLDMAHATRDADPAGDTRSAGEILKAVAAGDQATRALVAKFSNRAYSGGTSGDDARYSTPTFVSDLTRIIDNANPLASLFSTGSLPASGRSIEFSRVKSNTVTVGEQVAEGDSLPLGKVTTETDSAVIKTYGGYSPLSLQEIERTPSNMLDLTLKALAVEAGKRKANDFAAFYETVVAAQATVGGLSTTKEASALTWADLVAIISDATDIYTELAVPADGLIVDTPTWKALASLTATDGRPLMNVTGTGTNTIGTLNPALSSGSLSGITVVKNAKQTAAAATPAAFYNADALRVYSSGIAQLSDTSVIELVNYYSVYYYSATADEWPGHIVPLKLGAEA